MGQNVEIIIGIEHGTGTKIMKRKKFFKLFWTKTDKNHYKIKYINRTEYGIETKLLKL